MAVQAQIKWKDTVIASLDAVEVGSAAEFRGNINENTTQIAEAFNSVSKEYATEMDKQYKDQLIKMRVNIAAKMYEYRNENILFEGAQGAMLDIDSGTYPYVSSGASGSYGAASGSGIGPKALDKIYGVFKAYETRVGNGPMPSEFNAETEGELCDYVRNTGNEFGVTTGRPRRCGLPCYIRLRSCHRSYSP